MKSGEFTSFTDKNGQHIHYGSALTNTNGKIFVVDFDPHLEYVIYDVLVGTLEKLTDVNASSFQVINREMLMTRLTFGSRCDNFL